MQNVRLAKAIALAMAVSFSAPPTLAQDVIADPPIEETASAAAICLSAPLRDVPQVSQAQRGQAFRLVAPAGELTFYQAKGFSVVECTVADLVTAEKRGGFRDEICELAAYGNAAVQDQLARALGERPAVMCASAQAVAGKRAGRAE